MFMRLEKERRERMENIHLYNNAMSATPGPKRKKARPHISNQRHNYFELPNKLTTVLFTHD